MRWYWQVFRQYADFSGRANRKEYWLFVLWNFIIGTVLEMVGLWIFRPSMSPLSWIYALVVFIPELALQFRRLHDAGHTGWALLLGLIPIVGWIILLVYMIQPGQKQANAYGEARYQWSPDRPF